MKRNVKIFCAALALVLVFGAVVGGTIAWLMDSTESITNTFTIGNVSITLQEKIFEDGTFTGEYEQEGEGQTFSLIPGETYKKAPIVDVVAGSETCWVFVKIDEPNNDKGNNEKFVQYTIDENWLKVADGIYGYKEVVDQDDTLTSVIANETITINPDTTADDMTDFTTDGAPELTFTAYAIQSDNIGADSATAVWTTYGAALLNAANA